MPDFGPSVPKQKFVFQAHGIISGFQLPKNFTRQHSNRQNFGQPGKRLRQTGFIWMSRLIQCGKSATDAWGKSVSQGKQMKATVRHESESSGNSVVFKLIELSQKTRMQRSVVAVANYRWFLHHGFAMEMNSYSQSGEDLLLWEYFGARTNGFFLEAGANHPTKLSQTWLFELHGWKGILVEPLAKNCALLRQHRPGSRVFQCALGAPEQRGRAKIKVAGGDDALSGLVVDDDVIVERMEEVEVRTLDEVLAQAGNPKLDFMSLDVEGFELQVLRGFDLMRHRPAMLLIEDHLENLLVHRHLVQHGYRVVKRTGVNNWYVPKRQPFHMTTHAERLKLFRKMFLGLPFRKIRLSLGRRKHRLRSPA